MLETIEILLSRPLGDYAVRRGDSLLSVILALYCEREIFPGGLSLVSSRTEDQAASSTQCFAGSAGGPGTTRGLRLWELHRQGLKSNPGHKLYLPFQICLHIPTGISGEIRWAGMQRRSQTWAQQCNL